MRHWGPLPGTPLPWEHISTHMPYAMHHGPNQCRAKPPPSELPTTGQDGQTLAQVLWRHSYFTTSPLSLSLSLVAGHLRPRCWGPGGTTPALYTGSVSRPVPVARFKTVGHIPYHTIPLPLPPPSSLSCPPQQPPLLPARLALTLPFCFAGTGHCPHSRH